jgi:hypothetical protein
MFEPQLPPHLLAIVARALERDPSKRYPHAGALGYELRKVAMAMGVGDGRHFLRSALARLLDDEDELEEVTNEMRLPRPSLPSRISSVDRFARLRGSVPPPPPSEEEYEPPTSERLNSGTVAVAGAPDDDEDDVEEA